MGVNPALPLVTPHVPQVTQESQWSRARRDPPALQEPPATLLMQKGQDLCPLGAFWAEELAAFSGKIFPYQQPNERFDCLALKTETGLP